MACAAQPAGTPDPAICCATCRDVLDGANELRVMLCRDKMVQSSSGQKRGTSVIAACGASHKGQQPTSTAAAEPACSICNILTDPAPAVASTTGQASAVGVHKQSATLPAAGGDRLVSLCTLAVQQWQAQHTACLNRHTSSRRVQCHYSACHMCARVQASL
jgi:hypothetical protein